MEEHSFTFTPNQRKNLANLAQIQSSYWGSCGGKGRLKYMVPPKEKCEREWRCHFQEYKTPWPFLDEWIWLRTTTLFPVVNGISNKILSAVSKCQKKDSNIEQNQSIISFVNIVSNIQSCRYPRIPLLWCQCNLRCSTGIGILESVDFEKSIHNTNYKQHFATALSFWVSDKKNNTENFLTLVAFSWKGKCMCLRSHALNKLTMQTTF